MNTVQQFWHNEQEFSELPADYESWSAAQKQEFLWQERILKSKYDQLPPLTGIDILGLFLTPYRLKMDRTVDEAPHRWRKAIHAHGTVAKIKFVPMADTPFTGLFKGADFGLLRASITGDPSDRGFAPGLAIKLFIDGKPSENFSALVSLTGQGKNYNFFAHEFSNIVPVVNELGPRLINWMFSRVSRFPTKLYLEDFAKFDQQGNPVSQPHFPYQVFLSPNPEFEFPSNMPHDFRLDLAVIPAGSLLFSVLAVDPKKLEKDPNKASDTVDRPGYRQQAQLIGKIETTSDFVASYYGDTLLFFRHQRFGNR